MQLKGRAGSSLVLRSAEFERPKNSPRTHEPICAFSLRCRLLSFGQPKGSALKQHPTDGDGDDDKTNEPNLPVRASLLLSYGRGNNNKVVAVVVAVDASTALVIIDCQLIRSSDELA